MAQDDPFLSEMNDMFSEVVDDDAEGLEKFRTTIDVPDNLKREMRFADAYRIGRKLSVLRANIDEAYRRHEDLDDREKFSSVGYVLSEIFYIEMILAITSICPETRAQMQKERKVLASHYIRKYNEKEDDEQKDQYETYISENDAANLIHKIVDWQYITSTEIKQIEGFSVSQDTRLNLSDILETPSTFFDDSVWEWMDSPPKQDFIEACRCLAFSSPTASVMLSLRAAEYNLRNWYEFNTGREIENRTWGQVIGELEDAYEVHDRPAVLSNLDYLKEKRNAVSHPEESPSTRSSERMLYRVEGTISEIYNQIHQGQ